MTKRHSDLLLDKTRKILLVIGFVLVALAIGACSKSDSAVKEHEVQLGVLEESGDPDYITGSATTRDYNYNLDQSFSSAEAKIDSDLQGWSKEALGDGQIWTEPNPPARFSEREVWLFRGHHYESDPMTPVMNGKCTMVIHIEKKE